MVWDNDSSDQGSSRGYAKYLNFGYILKVETIGFADRLNISVNLLNLKCQLDIQNVN